MSRKIKKKRNKNAYLTESIKDETKELKEEKLQQEAWLLEQQKELK